MKRPRGRPKGSKAAPKPKAVPKTKAAVVSRPKKAPPVQADSEDSTTDEETLGHVMQDDLETNILQFLHKRRVDQQSKRNALWRNLASSGLR